MANGYHGVATTRSEALSITGLPTAYPACVQSYSSSPVYTTQWLNMNGAAVDSNAMEIGTGHQCANNYRYWYWGYQWGTTWHEIGNQTIYGTTTHTFWMTKVGTSLWNYNIDGVTMGSLNWPLAGPGVAALAGLESYCSGCTISTHSYSNTRVRAVDGNWYQMNWPAVIVDPAPMDGTWYSPHQLNACQNASC